MRLFLLVICILTAGLIGSAQQTQQELDDALRTPGPDTRAGTFAAMRGIPQQEREPDLVHALEEADRLRRDLEQRRLAIREGPLPDVDDEGEYLFLVLSTLARSHNPVVIRPLVAFIGTGNHVTDAIADFGEEAVTDVLIVASASSDDLAAGSAMGTLKKMLERASVRRPLSADSKRRITGVASDRFRGSQTAAILSRAVGLAVATGDPALIQRVKLLASDDRAVRELGIIDQGSIQGIRFTARKALAERGMDIGRK